MNKIRNEYPWLKNRGYPHITPQLNIVHDKDKIISIVKNSKFIAKYAFFPLIHSTINEPRYKRIKLEESKRSHKSKNNSGEIKRNAKSRPLHYATHFDAIIYGYYAELLLNKYEEKLLNHPLVADCITAYRRIPIINSENNKSTIHYAHEAFNEIKERAKDGCSVLKFDIKSFFSRINHEQLKNSWANILGVELLPEDHYNLFKAVTKFSYILKDDLRVNNKRKGRRSGFDEKKLADIRKTGKISFFFSSKEFREAIKDGNLKLHKFPFRDSNGLPVGIPQGLPISAVLANIYLLSFDLKIINELVIKLGVYYRRYSDDIILICKPEQTTYVENFIVEGIKESKVEMSPDKTESFLFLKTLKNGISTIKSIKVTNTGQKEGLPFTYLGFEFYGDKTLIKSSNLAKFYRRMISAVKIKAKRAISVSEKYPDKPIVIYRNQLIRLYEKFPLSSSKVKLNFKRLVKNEKGEFELLITKRTKPNNSNYLSYVFRASEIMNESAINNQIRNHKKIFNQAINKHLNKAKSRLANK